jgi:sigma-B regulation protein RsbU (phosphoserine phosphatase)
MPGTSIQRLFSIWRRLTRLDQVALGIVLLEGAVWLAGRSGLRIAIPGFLTFPFFLAVSYLLVRFLGWARARLLWSLRNRLIVAYVFIAVVPILLLLTLAVTAASILYSQLGAYLLYDDLHRRVEILSDAAEHLAVAQAAIPSRAVTQVAEAVQAAQMHATHDQELPGLAVEFHADPSIFRQLGRADGRAFAGIVQTGESLRLVALRRLQTSRGEQVISLTVPLTSDFLETIAPDLGPIQLILSRLAKPGDQGGLHVSVGDLVYRLGERIGTRRRKLQLPALWFDFPVEGRSKLDTVLQTSGEVGGESRPVFGVFTARPSQLNRRLFSSVGEFSGKYFIFLVVMGVFFLVIEIAALITGVVLTRTITKAVADLYRATQYVQGGDLSHRVRIERKDQLGVLGESFNLMTSSVSNLIEEQRLRQKLDNELSIAREVQAQLFPQKMPVLPGVHLKAICRAARVVSGDYYDFLQLGPSRLGMAIADISGKGISAALLMASLQAALRSQVMTSGGGSGGTAELVERLNRHMYLNTSDDRFATFFYAEYDCSSRMLTYTNAGHLPPLYLCNGKVQKLDKGGMVVGVVEQYPYEQGRIHIEPGGMLVGYSDGLVEPENVYGEEFGIKRLAEVAMRLRDSSPQNVAESLMVAAEEWAGTPEQADDMTVIVARMD